MLIRAKAAGIAWPLEDDATNEDIQAILSPGKYAYASPYTVPDYAYMHRELAKNGVTLTHLWEEYCVKVRGEGGVPYSYTQYCEKYHRWARVTKATMFNASTIEQLRAMKFSAMATAFEQQLKEPKSYSQLGFEERFGLMVDAEWNRRQDNKLRRRVRDARLDIPSASMEGIEYIPDRGLDRQQLLRLASCAYIDEGHHVILKGASGSGKTYLACALGYAAYTRFQKVRYVRMPELLDELVVIRADNLLKTMSREPLINSAAHLAVPFPPCKLANFLTYLQ